MKKGWGAAALFLGGIVLAGMGVRACRDLPQTLSRRTAQGVRESVAEIFLDLLHVRPEVREGTRVTWGQTSARTEIVVAEKRIEVKYDWEHQWMGSRKTIRLTQEYLVKAGFDLGKPFWVEMGPGPGEVTACLPPAEILAVSPVGPPSYADDDGWWNKVTDADRSAALARLAGEAKQEARRSGILRQAEELTGNRLTELARGKAIRLKIVEQQP